MRICQLGKILKKKNKIDGSKKRNRHVSFHQDLLEEDEPLIKKHKIFKNVKDKERSRESIIPEPTETFSKPAKNNSNNESENKNSNNKYACDMCKKSFTDKSNLFRHKKVHSNFRLNCDQCEKSYTTRSDLTRHMKTHSNVTFPFQQNLIYQDI